MLQAFEKISLRSKLLAKANTNTKYYGMQKEAQKEMKEEKPFPENGEKKTAIVWGSMKCCNCQGTGHLARNCKKKDKERNTCYKCGEKGHIPKECE